MLFQTACLLYSKSPGELFLGVVVFAQHETGRACVQCFPHAQWKEKLPKQHNKQTERRSSISSQFHGKTLYWACAKTTTTEKKPFKSKRRKIQGLVSERQSLSPNFCPLSTAALPVPPECPSWASQLCKLTQHTYPLEPSVLLHLCYHHCIELHIYRIEGSYCK